MAIDSWLPVGHKLPSGARSRTPVHEGTGWQIFVLQPGGRALVARDELAQRWFASGLIERGALSDFEFGNERFWSMSSDSNQQLCPVADAQSPDTKAEALAFAQAYRATRGIDAESPLQDALYVEKISRLLPTYSITARTDDDVVVGYWLTGGAHVSVKSFRRLSQTLSWLGASHLKEVVETAGFNVTALVPSERKRSQNGRGAAAAKEQVTDGNVAGIDETSALATFDLPGRPELAAFFNEHIIDIVQNRERYRSLGIEFPSAVILHGPPGCGKTFAVDRLIDFLGWPNFQIDASSVASPYIHETSKKVAEVFEKAMQSAPSVLVIDEMEAFLADREMGSGHHRVEEVAEFLRRIPEATQNDVLIVAMTNRVDMIDPAILRRGRFDHVIKVDYASETEVLSLLNKLLSTLPADESVDTTPLAKELAGRPLSDVAFVIREGARLSARSGNDRLTQQSILSALSMAPAREREGATKRRIGFF